MSKPKVENYLDRIGRVAVLCGLTMGLILGAGAPIIASAQTSDYDDTILPNCLMATPRPNDNPQCIGKAADACIATEAGSSTVGLGFCYSQEWEQWDARLNAAYSALLVQQAELASDNAAFNEAIPNAVDVMREMQRDWIAYRDHACEWEYVQWGGGTGGGPASASCMMRLTAQQALFLEGKLY